MTKAERLREMERLYVQRAFSDQEMADRLEVDRTTVFRHRVELEEEYPFTVTEDGRHRIDRSKYLSGIKVNLHEALALYLAARRVSRQTSIAQPHVVSALEKLAEALRQPMTGRLVKAAGVVLQQTTRPERVQVVEEVARAWVESRKVEIHYRALGSSKTVQHLLSPYLIEPSLWGEGVYVIGHSETMMKLATFKVDRIEKAQIRLTSFTIPENFDEKELLRHAWGIWYGAGETTLVRLRFRPGPATQRVRENIWHPQQAPLQETADGGVIWEAEVAEWFEMLPWVRGWGADVEVLAPEELREALISEVQEMAELYGRRVVEISGEEKGGASPVDETRAYYAHSNGVDRSQWQSLKDHLINTSKLAYELGQDANISEMARLAAILHDIGKYSQAFQRRLQGAKQLVDHATAGAKEAVELFQRNENQKNLALLLAYCIAGHHSGLPDFGSVADVDGDGTLMARLLKKKIQDYSAYKSEIDPTSLVLPERLSITPIKGNPGFTLALYIRMLYSTLVDADFLETETYMNGGEKPRRGFVSIESLCQQFNAFLKCFEQPVGAVNQKRTETLRSCLSKASHSPGFFTLTVPTGGGKTYASMAFALNHAVAHGMKRIIYVIPFTSIIEQNAALFKDVLGEENVLEHHSNFDWRQRESNSDGEVADDQTYRTLEKLKLASENWDIPIIVTTNVQFFESLFANRSSRCRKLHNLAKSVIIFDEAQMLPREYMRPCMAAVAELVQNYGASAVFCTATQPAVDRFLPSGSQIRELADDPQDLFNFYRRVKIQNAGKLTDDDLLEMIHAQQQVLCIINTRKHAKGLFDGLEEDGRFHLSTLMCPAHRKETIAIIRKRLKDGLPCRVVSTQILEAGVDMDFPVGFRAIAGLDSIIQAAGRVNREGHRTNGELHVFEPDSAFVKRIPTFVKQGAAVGLSILKDFSADPTSTEAIQAYFKSLYSLHSPSAFDQKAIMACFDKGTQEVKFDFRQAAERFRLIDNLTVAVIVPYNEDAEDLLERMRWSEYPASFARKLQAYTVNIYEQEFLALQSQGVIDTYADTYSVLKGKEQYGETCYHPETGLVIPASNSGEAIFFDG
jgi:CRISPR-associated endonuclease/helicase Cas3